MPARMPYIRSLNGLRSVAVVLLLLFHAGRPLLRAVRVSHYIPIKGRVRFVRLGFTRCVLGQTSAQVLARPIRTA